ncbi:TonB-dependent receptor [Sporocytophaga myxococcoides]|uniref:TonB-dependent receptor n=1 Tax=Sporocytophaga myxococcoides TaxID=153721 RepID=UPI00041445EC|nr:TonB-dependent receptor [Sporocytophaga myxococcoides]
MIKYKILSFILVCLVSSNLCAQYNLSGTVLSLPDSSYMKNCNVYLNEKSISVSTDSLGKFEFRDLPAGQYTLVTSFLEYHTTYQKVSINKSDTYVKVFMKSVYSVLDEVIVTHAPADEGHLRAVENMGIYEGKKSEVIVPDKLTVNLATNNARQVYSRVAGLNIYENDGAGLQLSIGGRGLDPNRTSNFNVRQNGYDISADALGYPESYYTPPVEAIEKIQIVRGAASLQYGTQFGGLVNFVLRKPVEDKKIQLVARQSVGSYGFYNAFTSLSGTVGKVSYYSFFQYKRADGWRPNSGFDAYNFYTNLNYKLSPKSTLGFDITIMDYLAQQAGGLNDKMFKENPRQSNRDRNWFKVNWNLAAIHFTHKFSASSEFNIRMFGLSALRYSLGFRPVRVESPDDNSKRDLIKGEFNNWGAEARYLKRYMIGSKNMVVLVGGRFYHGLNHSTQGLGTAGTNPDFNYIQDYKYKSLNSSDYRFPNNNVALFAENIIYLSDKFSITPGIRYEYINTTSDGSSITLVTNNAGVVRDTISVIENRVKNRQFILGGIGFGYRPTSRINIYANVSQNYRSITFSDMQIINPSSVIDPNLKDERGYSADIGIRSEQTNAIIYDLSLFYVNYANRIGEAPASDKNDNTLRKRGNIGEAVMMGVECYLEGEFFKLAKIKTENWNASAFVNLALIHSKYLKSELKRVKGSQVEFVPKVNLKTGLRAGYKNLKASFQLTYLSDQYTDATNEREGGSSGVIGVIPAYTIMDFSLSYEYKIFKLEGSINNLANQMYFTRRATGYPGPGILPSDGRGFYLTLQVKI